MHLSCSIVFFPMVIKKLIKIQINCRALLNSLENTSFILATQLLFDCICNHYTHLKGESFLHLWDYKVDNNKVIATSYSMDIPGFFIAIKLLVYGLLSIYFTLKPSILTNLWQKIKSLNYLFMIKLKTLYSFF